MQQRRRKTSVPLSMIDGEQILQAAERDERSDGRLKVPGGG